MRHVHTQSIHPTPPDHGPPLLMTVRQVAELCEISPRTVRRLADGGRMPTPTKLGALIRWSRPEIEAWIASGCRPPTESTPEDGNRRRGRRGVSR
jgi:excisionase family DNA binding protein